MTEAKTEEEQKFFRWIGEECNEEKLEEFLSSKTQEEKTHLFNLVNYNGRNIQQITPLIVRFPTSQPRS
jgi:hypothetical protein